MRSTVGKRGTCLGLKRDTKLVSNLAREVAGTLDLQLESLPLDYERRDLALGDLWVDCSSSAFIPFYLSPMLFLLRSHTLWFVHPLIKLHLDILAASLPTLRQPFCSNKRTHPKASIEVAVRKRKVATAPRRRNLLLRPEWIDLHGRFTSQSRATLRN